MFPTALSPASGAHAQCSEGFYKKELESDIHSSPSKTAQERAQMMQVLKHFEETSAEQDLELLDSDDEEEDAVSDLAKRLQNVDLDSASPDAIWHLLTEEEKRKFVRALDNPDSELAQTLLSSEVLEQAKQTPWWESDDVAKGSSEPRQRGTRPEAIKVPVAMVKPHPTGPSLVFNMAAICLAYAYTTRHLATSPLSSLFPESADHEQARQAVGQIVPFLVDRSGTTLYTNMSSMITDVWSRFSEGAASPELFSILLGDVAELLQPLPVVAVGDGVPDEADIASHPHAKTLYVVSDLVGLFEGRKSVCHKLVFYAAHIMSTPSLVLRSVSEEAAGRSRAEERGHGL
ncbi:hypothetical protein AX16_001426 [Volvariella volvacea WC 439]|nr:hypothetical protein AX16_001426 [Volvariella volvacea WC 439]